jgi:hypothetical protein
MSAHPETAHAPWQTSLLQRLRTSEAQRLRHGTAPPPVVLQHAGPIAPMRFAVCQWVTEAAPPWPRCGAPTKDGGAWCVAHRAVVFQPRVAVR